MTDQEALERAARAESMVNDPLFTGAFEKLRTGYIRSWVGCEDAEEREQLWNKVQVIDQIKREFLSIITNGKIITTKNQDREKYSQA